MSLKRFTSLSRSLFRSVTSKFRLLLTSLSSKCFLIILSARSGKPSYVTVSIRYGRPMLIS